MSSSTLDFRVLRTTVSLEQVLVARGVAGRLRQEGDRLVGPCPVHHGDNPGAFVADLRQNLWHCFTQCDGGGDVVELVRRLDGVGYRDAARALARLVGAVGAEVRAEAPRSPDAPPGTRPTAPFRPFIRRLDLDSDVPWLRAKGIRPETARRFEAGCWRGTGWLTGCIGVRLHDPEGRPLGYAGRRLDPSDAARQGKWKLPPGLPRRTLLYNIHRLGTWRDTGVVVVECPWGVMRLAQLGVPAVALLGTALSDGQHRLLAGARGVLLLLDGDEAGRRATDNLARRLSPEVAVASVHLPEGADPDDLIDAELASSIEPFFPF